MSELLKVGNKYRWHDKTVEIVGGQYMGQRGISNWWQWVEILPDGTRGPVRSGYDNEGAFEPMRPTPNEFVQ